MAEAVRRGFRDLLLEVAGTYPAAVRYGGGYYSEVVGNVSGYVADVLEAFIAVSAEPQRSREVLSDLTERTRQYLVASGSTFERILLDFNQALVKVSRMYPEASRVGEHPAEAPAADRLAELFRQLSDLAAGEALKLQTTPGRLDVEALRRHLEACLSALRHVGNSPIPDPPPAGGSAGP